MGIFTKSRDTVVEEHVDASPMVSNFHQTLQRLIVETRLLGGTANTKALAVAAVFRARQMTADTLSSLPVMAGDTPVPAPSAEQDIQDFVSDVVLGMLDHGEAYVDVKPNGDVKVLNPSGMVVGWTDVGRQTGTRTYDWHGTRLRTAGVARNLIVVAMNRGVADLSGKGPMQSKRISGLLAEQEYSQEYFENNAQPTGTLEHPGVLTPTEAKALFDAWEAGQSERTTGVLSGGLKYNPESFNPSDSEWVETHAAGILDAATLFGIPAALLNAAVAGSSLTYQNVGSVYEGYWRSTLAPTFARRIEAMWTSVLKSPVKFIPDELFLASLKERTDATGTLVRVGFEPDAAADVAGLPKMAHTGILPAQVSQEGATT